MSRTHALGILALGIVLVSSSRSVAQAGWSTDLVVPKPRAVHAAVYDTARKQIVMFGGNTNSGVQGDTWVWSSAGGWIRPNPTTAPTARREHGMAYDPVNSKVVLFGGVDTNGALLNDTWLWDGTAWTKAAPATIPTARTAELAFDVVGARVLMFGGDAGSGTRLNDTWAWTGTNWQQLSPATVPPARADHGVATDWGRAQLVMFGGWNSGFLADTWIWQGNNWVQQTVVGPSARSEHRMAYDGTNVVLFSGDTGAGRPQDTWVWNGAIWTLAASSKQPLGREEHEMIDIQNGVMLFGGWAPVVGHLADPWTFAAGQWTRLGSDSPPGTGTHAMAHDRSTGFTLLFGGYQDAQINGSTWLYQSGLWLSVAPPASPPARAEPAMAFDELRGEYVLFGGVNGSTYHNDTWVFRAGTWTQQNPVTSPPARWGHVMAFDRGRGTVVLFSGRQGGASNDLLDTWEWNGVNWVQLNPATSPPGREDPALVFDSKRGELVLFGGWVQGAGFANDTWAFRNGNWVQLQPTSSPSPRSEHVMAYDSWRDRIVVFSGEDKTGRVGDTWEFDGTTWIQRSPKLAPAPREEAAMVFDELAGECVLFAGWDVGHFHDTWHYGSKPAATVISYGAGCSGAAPSAPTLRVDRLWLGDTVMFQVDAALPMPKALLLFGLQKTNVPLDPMGMKGCVLLTTPVLEYFIPTSGRTGTFQVPMPTTTSLIGVKLLSQAAAEQSGANPLGLLATEGLEATVGMK